MTNDSKGGARTPSEARIYTRRRLLLNSNSKKVVNMENEKYTPNGWHWKITPEQIEKIKE